MRRDVAKSEAKKLSPVMAALNAAPDVLGGDPLIGPFSKGWVESGIVFRSAYNGKKAGHEPLGKLLQQYAADRERQPGFARSLLHDELTKLFDKKAGKRNRAIVTGGDLLRSARRFREWIAMCIRSRAAAGRLMRDLERSHTRPSVTDIIARHYLSRIVELGIFRCQYAKCGKLVLNTSGHGGRRYCTGTKCAGNDTHARMAAEEFAKLQAEKIHRAKAAISTWPGTGDLKSWIVDHAAVTRRWVTEAARRGDIHVPGERRIRRRHRAQSRHVANVEMPLSPIRRIQRRSSDDWEEDPRKTEPRWIHDGKDARGRFKMVKLDGKTFRVYRHFCRTCNEEVGTLLICPNCKAEQPRRPA